LIFLRQFSFAASLYADVRGVQEKVSESYAQPVASMGYQARKGAFGVHDRLLIKSPNSCSLAFVMNGLLGSVNSKRPRICKDGHDEQF
jgi:hypothetical protein